MRIVKTPFFLPCGFAAIQIERRSLWSVVRICERKHCSLPSVIPVATSGRIRSWTPRGTICSAGRAFFSSEKEWWLGNPMVAFADSNALQASRSGPLFADLRQRQIYRRHLLSPTKATATRMPNPTPSIRLWTLIVHIADRGKSNRC